MANYKNPLFEGIPDEWLSKKDGLAKYRKHPYYGVLMTRFYRAWMSAFKIEGVPESWGNYLFRQLWMVGLACAFKADLPGDPVLYFSTYSAVRYGGNDYPTLVQVINERNLPGYPPARKRLAVVSDYVPEGKVALVRAFPSQCPVFVLYDFYACKICEVQTSIDTNLEQVVLPVGIPTSGDKQYKTRSLTKAVEEHSAFYLFDDEESRLFAPTPMQGQYYIDKLIQYRKDWENEAKNLIGIDSSAEEKRERLLMDEVNANNAEINLQRQSIMLNLEAFSKDIKLLGFDVTFKSRIEEAQAEMTKAAYEEKGDGEDGKTDSMEER